MDKRNRIIEIAIEDKLTFERNKKCDGCRYDWGDICGNPMMAKLDYSCWTGSYMKGGEE